MPGPAWAGSGVGFGICRACSPCLATPWACASTCDSENASSSVEGWGAGPILSDLSFAVLKTGRLLPKSPANAPVLSAGISGNTSGENLEATLDPKLAICSLAVAGILSSAALANASLLTAAGPLNPGKLDGVSNSGTLSLCPTFATFLGFNGLLEASKPLVNLLPAILGTGSEPNLSAIPLPGAND